MFISENQTPNSFQTAPDVVAAGATIIRDSNAQQTGASSSPGGTETLLFDKEYLLALTNRAEDVVRHFILHFSRPVKSKLVGQLRSRDLREDAFQETFRRVLSYFQSGKTLENPARLPAFVFAVCHNTALELLRPGSRHQQSTQGSCDPVDPAQSPEDRMIQEEQKQIARRILEELREKDRELLRRVFLDEEDRDLVCKQLGVDRNYLRVLLYRARKRMKTALADSTFPRRA